MTFAFIIALVSPVYGEGVHRCTEEYKFSYYDGKYCCRTQRENTFARQGELCDGGPLGFYSKCCAGDQYQPCENPPCWNYDASARASSGVYPADPVPIATPVPAAIATPAPAATPSLRNDQCHYECTGQGGCGVKYTGSNPADGRTYGSCYPKSYGGECGNTPSACRDCNTMITCEESAPVATAPVATAPVATAPAAAASNLQATSIRESTYDRSPGMGWAGDNNNTKNNMKQINLPHNSSHLACEAECNKTQYCVAYTYVKNYNRCDLKSPTGARQLKKFDPKWNLYSGKKMNYQPEHQSVAPSRPAHQTVAPSPPAVSASGPTSGTLTGWENEMMRVHNFLRCMHGVEALEWDPALQESAKQNAGKQRGRSLIHYTSSGGENLYMSSSSMTTSEEVIFSWWGEHEQYSRPVFSEATGHFTQIVWRDASKLGCASVSRGNNHYVSCRYDTGNMVKSVDPPDYRLRDPTQVTKRCVKPLATCEAKFGKLPSGYEEKLNTCSSSR